MKLICSKDNLLNGINIVMKAVPANTTMSILNCILVDATENVIKLTANDGDLGIETIIEGTIAEKGMIAIDAKTFSEIVRSLPDEDITLDVDKNNNINVIYGNGKSHFNINGENGESFSYLPYIEKNEAIVISQLAFKDVIRQTIFSIDSTSSNKIMSGVHLFINGEKLKATSTDSHRISIRNVMLKNSYAPVEAIVPGKALNEISKIITGGAEDELNIYITKNHILFEFGVTKVVSRLIEGKYFDVNKMISPDYETKVTINKKSFLDCLSRSLLLSKEGNKKPIVIDIVEDVLSIGIEAAMGSMNEQISIEKDGKDIMIGFNPKFLADSLKVIDDETINIYLLNSRGPCYIKDENESYIYLVLPINLNK